MPPKPKVKPSKDTKAEVSIAPTEKKVGKSGKGKPGVSNESNDSANKYSKSARKTRQREIEANRLRERDEMMKIYDSSDDDDADGNEVEESKPASKFTVDKFGNKISKAKLAEEQRLQAMREEARLRREKRGIGVSGVAIDSATAVAAPDSAEPSLKNDSNDGDSDVANIQQKLSDGLKLTHKERRVVQAANRDALQAQSQAAEAELGLPSFSLSIKGESTSAGDDNLKCLSATDIIVPSFTITAPERPLFVDASLRIVSGRKYGLLGPNGR
jgi:hypothetical protein